MKILVCGSRHWTDRATIYNTLDEIGGTDEQNLMPYKIDLLIHGGCGHLDEVTCETVGADLIADEWAIVNWVLSVIYQEEYGLRGGPPSPEKHATMLEESKPDLVLAFHDDMEASNGTKDMVAQARRAGVPVRIVTSRTSGKEKEVP